MGYSLGDHKESDRTECAHTHTHTHTHTYVGIIALVISRSVNGACFLNLKS